MRLFIFLAHDPRLDAVEHHVVDCHSVTQVNSLLQPQNAKDLQLNRSKIIQHLVQLDVFLSVLDALINRDD